MKPSISVNPLPLVHGPLRAQQRRGSDPERTNYKIIRRSQMSNLLSEAFSAVPSSVGLPTELRLIMEIQFSLLRSGVKRSHCVNCCYANHFQPLTVHFSNGKTAGSAAIVGWNLVNFCNSRPGTLCCTSVGLEVGFRFTFMLVKA